MKKSRSHFLCQNCGYQSPKWLGKCPACEQWHQFAEEEPVVAASPYRYSDGPAQLVTMGEIAADEKDRILTGIGEIDRVLGGGLVEGSAVLVGGEPGIGKSTLLLQVLEKLAQGGLKVLYVSGEESAEQIKLRGRRIGALSENILILLETDLDEIIRQLEVIAPQILVIDSIQTVNSSALPAALGSVNQIRECAGRLIIHGKKRGIPIFLIGHVTKEGAIAGPKVLEHMVDTVLYFEGDAGHQYRIVRAIKNRFGPTNEIGVFEMGRQGLCEVGNPSAFFLTTGTQQAAGSIVAATIEGTRPILVEIQSLVIPNNFGAPRRTANGVDHNRVSLLVAVMDKVCGHRLTSHDIFLNVVGGIKIDEPAVDLGIVASLLSSLLERPVGDKTVVFGEVGLTGEVRGASQGPLRIREAQRMGFRRCIIPHGQTGELPGEDGMKLLSIGNLKELSRRLFDHG
ncbi:MAG: DNA repair protein RadA [Smithellaceae bacterium]|nr:DNA repair protein RadA [Smithellaceae bacterium]